jgi:hypothetical protein
MSNRRNLVLGHKVGAETVRINITARIMSTRHASASKLGFEVLHFVLSEPWSNLQLGCEVIDFGFALAAGLEPVFYGDVALAIVVCLYLSMGS